MFLRRLSTTASAALRRGANDDGVLAALREEISHELSSSSPSSPLSLHSQEILDFATVSDAPLRFYSPGVGAARPAAVPRRGAAAQGHAQSLMKVFVSKPGVTPVLRFDCRAVAAGSAAATDYDITAVCYHSCPGDAGDDKYEGPEFRYTSVSI